MEAAATGPSNPSCWRRTGTIGWSHLFRSCLNGVVEGSRRRRSVRYSRNSPIGSGTIFTGRNGCFVLANVSFSPEIDKIPMNCCSV